VSEVREIDEYELDRWVETMRLALDETDTADGYRDWKRQARETVWLLASAGGEDVGAALGIGGWHEPEGVARGEVRTIPRARGRRVGSALLEKLSEWASALGYSELLSSVKEGDDGSLAWARRRGFNEVGRNSRLVLDLTAIEAPGVAPPEGIEIVPWAARPELAAGMYVVAREAYVDVPGEEDQLMAPFDEWLAMDMQGASDRPEAIFAALAGDEVVAYAQLTLSLARPAVAVHGMTGVRRAWRGRGIANALKAAEIAWAKEAGFSGSRRATRSATSRSAG